ncbi:hypothetical protein GW17_00009136 [Ensete ventricosum]|nr:hypothetical protein GW17_00009136 [Ensete ventricosum]
MSQINTTQWKKDVSRERKQKYIFKNTESRRFVELMKKCADKLGTKSTVEFFDRLGREMGVREYSALIGLCISKARNCSNKEDSMVIGTRLGCTAKIDRRRLIEEEKREEVEEEERRRRGEEERSTSRRPRPCATPPASHPLASAVRGLPVNRRRPRSPANRRRPLSWAIFLLREEAERLPARGERSKRLGLRFAISTCNARYGWYIPVRQVAVAVETKVFLTEQSGSYRMPLPPVGRPRAFAAHGRLFSPRGERDRGNGVISSKALKLDLLLSGFGEEDISFYIYEYTTCLPNLAVRNFS